MKAIEFKGHNRIIAKNQPEYTPLPAFIDEEKNIAVTCYEFTDEEIEKLKKTKKLWVQNLIFGGSFQPVFMSVDKKEVINVPGDIEE